MKEIVKLSEIANSKCAMRHSIDEKIYGRASMTVKQMRPSNWLEVDGNLMPDPDSYKPVGEPETVWNLITNVGRIFLHTQGYGTSGIGSNGLNFIALSNDTLTETATSTVLSNEITLNGLGRAAGTVTLPTGSGNITTIDKTFTATGTQQCQKAALFTASSAGTMNHVLAFTQRSLISGDTIEITFSIQLA